MLYKRSSKPGARWWVRFTIKGEEIRQSSGTDRKELAEAFEQQLREAIWNEQNLGIETHTWGEACTRWFREKANKRSILRDRQAIAKLNCPQHTDIAEVFDVVSAANGRLAECGIRERATFRSILNACVRWNWLDRSPKVDMPHVEKHDPRWITEEQFERLCSELPPHAVQLARFAVATGLRRGNIHRLKWEAVDLRKGTLVVSSRDAKSGKSGGYPLNRSALDILRQQSGVHKTFVFADHAGRAPVGSIKTTWIKAVSRANLTGLRFHDLRHTWAAWHVLAGTPPIILKELGGWASLAMVERYGHIGTSHLADWADNSRTKSGTRKKRPNRKRLK